MNIEAFQNLGALAVLGLFIVVLGTTIRLLVNFTREQIIPIVRNHLVHIEESYTQLAAVYDQQANELCMHNELTKSLVEQVKIQNNILTERLDDDRRKRN